MERFLILIQSVKYCLTDYHENQTNKLWITKCTTLLFNYVPASLHHLTVGLNGSHDRCTLAHRSLRIMNNAVDDDDGLKSDRGGGELAANCTTQLLEFGRSNNLWNDTWWWKQHNCAVHRKVHIPKRTKARRRKNHVNHTQKKYGLFDGNANDESSELIAYMYTRT